MSACDGTFLIYHDFMNGTWRLSLVLHTKFGLEASLPHFSYSSENSKPL